MSKRLKPIHPGEILNTEFLEELEISPYRLSKSLGLSATHVGQILKGQRSITAPVAIRLGRFFKTGAQLWLALQADYDLEIAESIEGRKIKKEVIPLEEKKEAA